MKIAQLVNKLIFGIFICVATLSGATLELPSSVVSENEKYISSRNMGYAVRVNVKEGEIVKKGDELYSIDSKEMDANRLQVELMVEQAKLALNMRENQYFDVKRNLERFQRLYNKGLVSKFEVEQLELGEKNLKEMIEISKKQVLQADEQLKIILNQYKYLQIKAPNDGMVTKKMIKEGEMAIPGMPAFVLSDLEDLVVRTQIAESNLQNIKINQMVKIKIPSLGYEGDGKINAIIPDLNPMTHTFVIKIKFDIPKNCYPGMYAQVVLEI